MVIIDNEGKIMDRQDKIKQFRNNIVLSSLNTIVNELELSSATADVATFIEKFNWDLNDVVDRPVSFLDEGKLNKLITVQSHEYSTIDEFIRHSNELNKDGKIIVLYSFFKRRIIDPNYGSLETGNHVKYVYIFRYSIV